MNGVCVHKDLGVVSFINEGRAMRVMETGNIVIFHSNDKMKLRPLSSDLKIKEGMQKLKAGMEGKGGLSWLVFKRPSVGDDFVQMCEAIGFLMHKTSVISQRDKDLLNKLKKHVDLELSAVYPNVRGIYEK